MTTLATGFFFERPKETAPPFVKGKVSVKVEDAITFLKEHVNDRGYVNLDLLLSKEGNKPYFVLNDWKPVPKSDDLLSDGSL